MNIQNSLVNVTDYYIEASGIYLLQDPVPKDGVILNARAFGYPNLADFNESLVSDPNHFKSYLSFLVYRLNTEMTGYHLTHGPARITHNITEEGTLPINKDERLDWPVAVGDRLGVFIPSECLEGSSGVKMCPSQVNLDAGGKCFSALFYNASNSVTDIDDIPRDRFREVNLRLSVEVIIARMLKLMASNSISSNIDYFFTISDNNNRG